MNIILKCDDFWGKNWNKEKIFLDTVVRKNIKISLGIVGFGLANANQGAVEYLKKYADIIEPFNHSFWHVVGDPVKEFYKTSREYQQESICKTNIIIANRLGVIADTIGFPANACDQTTIDILEKYNSITNIYYTAKAHNREEIEKTGKRIINIDEETVFQIHPFVSDFSLEKLEKFIDDKLNAGHQFIWPSNL